ncbi:MAG: Gldg family protein [Lachnospiraceae bacterium]|nr:Gldg family protein [Lachnospiraceae bacterium]
MPAIYKRELKSYFHSFIGLLFIGVSLFFVGLYFTVYNVTYGSPYFSYAISSVIFVFLISVPVLTMRILAEERHNKTDQLILTAPVSVGKIVLGKYLALLTIFAIPTVIISVYPLILSRFGSVPLTECYLAILGYFLYGAACLAIGVLVSAMTESQVIAAVLTFGALFLGYMMSSICSIISSTGNVLTDILGLYDMYTPFAMLLNGTLDLASVVYFISLIAIALFLATQVIQKRRYSVSVKHFSVGAYSTVTIGIFVAAVVVVNMIVGQLPATITSIDVTSNQLYSITDQTKQFLDTLDEDISLYVLVNEEEQDMTLGQTLERYDDYSDHITVTYVDPVLNPKFASQYTNSSVYSNSIIVVSEQRSKVVSYADIYESSYDYTTYQSTTTGYDGEGQITSALDYVTSDDIPKVYLTQGHGESSFSYTLNGTLEKGNVETAELNLMDVEAVPEDAACVVIHAPQNDFSSDDKDKIISYLDQGGSVIFVGGGTETPLTNCEEILAYMNLTMTDGFVVEDSADHYYQVPFYLLPEVESHSYSNGIYGNYYVFAPYANGLIVPEDSETITYESILTTSDSAYAKPYTSESYEKEEGDAEGPFSIGVQAVKTLEEGEATLVAFSCSQIFTDSASEMVGGSNQQLIVNVISSFAGHEVNVSIPVKSFEVSYLTLSQSDIVLLTFVTTILLPVACLVIGFVIWFKRRRK